MKAPKCLDDWTKQVITGAGGLHDMWLYEWGLFEPDALRDTEVANFVIRCLANPDCEGSDVVLAQIAKRRAELDGAK